MKFFLTQWRELRTFWRESAFREEVKRSAIAFAVLSLLGFGVSIAFPELLDRVMRLVMNYFGGLDLTDKAGNISAVALFSNNVRACVVTMLYGLIPFIYLSALSLGMNSVLLGILAAYYLSGGHSLVGYFAVLLPHGIFELPALILAFAMGLFCCGQTTRRIRKEETTLRLSDCITQMSRLFLLVIVPLLFIAALMEAYVTPLVAAYFH